eukprot:scaffold82311_cov53-Phaeocystis_antarctica.AAC.2
MAPQRKVEDYAHYLLLTAYSYCLLLYYFWPQRKEEDYAHYVLLTTYLTKLLLPAPAQGGGLCSLLTTYHQ